ncbi:Lipin/Ned1/Smp2-domain-containing protein [Lactifluus subvellereus]|nr:Lipin/Ned1/Smp2-domain-containing protein [Lactifluus subvellereus]
MNYLWGAVNAISAPYQYYKDINPATLTGAIDVIVVRRPGFSGTMELACSPFHVRFGKWQVLRPSEKKVDITINGKDVPFNMKIGEAGEAFFVFETDDDVPDDLITSPLLEPTQPISPDPLPLGDISDDAVGQEPEFLDLDAPSPSGLPQSLPGTSFLRAVDSSSFVTAGNAEAPVSVEAQKGMPQKMHTSPVVTRSIAPPVAADHDYHNTEPDITKSDLEAHPRPGMNDFSTPHSTKSGDIEMGMAGFHSRELLNAHIVREGQDNTDGPHRYLFEVYPTTVYASDTSLKLPNPPPSGPSSPSHEPIPFPSLRAPSALPPDALPHSSDTLPQTSAPSDDYSWEWGGFPQRSQVHMQYATLQDPGPPEIVDGGESDGQLPASQPEEFQRSQSLPPEFELDLPEEAASSSLRASEQLPGQEPLSDVETGYDHGLRTSGRERRSWVRWWRRDSRHPQSVDVRIERPPVRSAASTPLPVEAERTSPVHVPTPDESARAPSVLSLPTSFPEMPPSGSSPSAGRSKTRYAKTLRLTSEQLQALDLRPGANTITFSLSSSGVVACAARIFMWEHTDSVVVSDIDGTITKSDALGHMLTLIGRDWTHLGVAKLYTDIYRNGYKIMYLTSRAIGQADSTRYYLQGIKQNDYQLPEGPVIMSPDRLMASLHREVIMRKPEVFKMACLRDIQRLFGPTAPLPFYAGFGNRITDALSYRSVNIPSSRIFTIDSNGEVKMELLDLVGHKSESVKSYIHMTDLVDQMFPPITHKWENEFTDNNYWKAPLAEFPLPDLAPPSPALSAHSDVSSQSAFARLRNFSLRSSSSSRSRALAPPPIDARRGRSMDATDAHAHQRQLSSIERLSNVLVGLASRNPSPSTSSAHESESEEDESSHGTSGLPGRRRRLRKRSTRSMPGSLPGSRPSSDEEDLEFGVSNRGTDDSTSDQGGETVEQEFDEDLFAAGEMEKVPFL